MKGAHTTNVVRLPFHDQHIADMNLDGSTFVDKHADARLEYPFTRRAQLLEALVELAARIPGIRHVVNGDVWVQDTLAYCKTGGLSPKVYSYKDAHLLRDPRPAIRSVLTSWADCSDLSHYREATVGFIVGHLPPDELNRLRLQFFADLIDLAELELEGTDSCDWDSVPDEEEHEDALLNDFPGCPVVAISVARKRLAS
jgi:hypothetical protein